MYPQSCVQDNIVELFRLNVVDNIRHECIERDVFRQQVLALPEPSLRRAADTVAHATQTLRDFLPAPSAMPSAMYEHLSLA